MQERAEFVLSTRLIARIAAQTCRQSGLSVVYTDLLDFQGDEIYFQEEPKLIGVSFGDAIHRYEDSSVIGIKHADSGPRLNPPMSTVIQKGDQLIAISLDDDTVRLSGVRDFKITEGAIQSFYPAPPNPEQVLMLGWNSQAAFILRELDRYVASDSKLTVVANSARAEIEFQMSCEDLSVLNCNFTRGELTNRAVLENIDYHEIDHVILLAETEGRTQEEADAATLVTLLHLRDIANLSDYKFSIVSEILDIRNRDLAEMARADDFIVSDRLVSLALAQISENQALGGVFDDLFSAEGAEIYIRSILDYVDVSSPLNFHTILESAKRRGEIAIGYRISADAWNPETAYGVVINPKKSEIRTFSEGDQVIVLAED